MPPSGLVLLTGIWGGRVWVIILGNLDEIFHQKEGEVCHQIAKRPLPAFWAGEQVFYLLEGGSCMFNIPSSLVLWAQGTLCLQHTVVTTEKKQGLSLIFVYVIM